MELTRLKGRLRTAQRGHKLLKDKRDELMKQFMEVVREDLALRQKVEQSLARAYGSFTVASGELDDAVRELGDILPDLLRLAEVEKATQLLAAEIERTRRRVNALEYVMIPELEQNIRYISMKLDANESSTKVRLMKVKEMVLEDAHHYKQ